MTGQETGLIPVSWPFFRNRFAGEYGRADISDEKTQIPEGVTPVLDDWMRGTWVTPGPDGAL